MEQYYFYARDFVSYPNKEIKISSSEFIYAEIRESHVSFEIRNHTRSENGILLLLVIFLPRIA